MKPKCKLTGEDGNVFNLVSIVTNCMHQNNLSDKVSEMQSKVFSANSYNEALQIFMEYVEVI